MGSSLEAQGVMSACTEAGQKKAAENSIEAAIDMQWENYNNATSGNMTVTGIDKNTAQNMMMDTYDMLGWNRSQYNQTKFDEDWEKYDHANDTMSAQNMSMFVDTYLWDYNFTGTWNDNGTKNMSGATGYEYYNYDYYYY